MFLNYIFRREKINYIYFIYNAYLVDIIWQNIYNCNINKIVKMTEYHFAKI